MKKEDLLSKYTKVLALYNNKIDKAELAQIIERAVTTIKYSYDNYDKQHQIAGAFVIVELYLKCKSFNLTQIEEILDEFYKYYDDEYKKYIESLVTIRDRMEADLTFYRSFIDKKKG